MPAETAATPPLNGSAASLPDATSGERARCIATKPPEIAAQRVPPSACRTSQSIQTVRSPSAAKSTTPRSERPIRRWISTVRPSGRPFVESRCLRSPVEAGSIPYSAVTQPVPLPAIQRGTLSCTVAVQMTRVRPIENSTDPAAVSTKSGSRSSGRRASAARPS